MDIPLLFLLAIPLFTCLDSEFYDNCGFINIRGTLIFEVWLSHEINYQRTSNSKSLFIVEVHKQRN